MIRPKSYQAQLTTRLITMRSQPNCFEVVLIGHIGDARSPEPEDWVQLNKIQPFMKMTLLKEDF